jgi:hypothetical protein
MRINMERFGTGMMLAIVTIGLAPESASAQNYPCPTGAGPGEQQIGMTGGGNSGLAPTPICARVDEPQQSESGPPAQQYNYYWADNYVAVAWHPDASDVWAIWNAHSAEEAKEGALRLCAVAMSEGCTIASAGSNSSIAIARAPDGTLWSGWGATPRKAKSEVLASCKKQGIRCTYERTFTGKPYRDAAGTMPLVKLEYYAPPFEALIRKR